MTDRGLNALARSYGIQTRYAGSGGERRDASPEALEAVLRALGAEFESAGELEDALWEREQQRHLRLVEPVSVCWEGTAPVVEIQPGRMERVHHVECRLTVESGEIGGGGVLEWTDEPPNISLPTDLPVGYHDLEITIGGRTATTRVIRAPRTTWDPVRRGWGAFLPLYALRSRDDWGTGDFSSLAELLEWTASLGGDVVGTLPIFAAFLSTPFDPSPYAPVSRLFWNELYVDPTTAPELAHAATARERLASDAFRERVRTLHRAPLVDYREAAALKREVLEDLARVFFAEGGWRSDAFHRFLENNPAAHDYARFRAAGELWERPWRDWPRRMRAGTLQEGDFAEDAARYHLYAQYLADRQLSDATDRDDAGLYLDLPLGVHPDGFDAWRNRELFADGISTGAPPDDFFRGGQDWGFPPLLPERIRENGYRYLAAVLGTICAAADVVRIDHVMALHRLFWVPRGMPATDGVYVGYPAEELWAVVCVESNRHRAAIVGEDLGTVPPEVREAMADRAARRMWVLPFEVRDDPPRIEAPPELSLATLDTHDTPPFAAWWDELPPERRRRIALAVGATGAGDDGTAGNGGSAGARGSAGDGEPAGGEMSETARARAVRDAALRFMSDSEARLIMVNLEDLWLEKDPQNEPGTTMEQRPNWRRKARFGIEMFREMPEVVKTLRAVDGVREAGRTEP